MRDRVNELERQAVRESDLTVCVSKLRCDELRAAVPAAADRVHHLPHGTPREVLSEVPQCQPGPAPADLAALPRPLLGYVGTLEDRVDWSLLSQLADRFPDASIVLVGRLGRASTGAWEVERRRCLDRPNVHAIGWRPQNAISTYNRAFDVCLIPYLTDHRFNRVCCPTKIMDYMGSGRPIVATDLPECRLYTELFHVAPTRTAFLDAVQTVLRSGSDDGRSALRHDWASEHSCARVIEHFLDRLPL